MPPKSSLVHFPDGYATFITHENEEKAKAFFSRMQSNPFGVKVELVANMRMLTGVRGDLLEEALGRSNAARYRELQQMNRSRRKPEMHARAAERRSM